MDPTERHRRAGVARLVLSALRRPAGKAGAAIVSVMLGLVPLVMFGSPAYAASSCGGAVYHPTTAYIAADNRSFPVTNVQYCSIWKSNTPVFDRAIGSKSVIGYLVNSGSSNWFVCRSNSYKDTYSANGYTSNDWAITLADNGNWGWVPAVYYGGSENYWAGLRECTVQEDP
jgi:hypothetical protein